MDEKREDPNNAANDDSITSADNLEALRSRQTSSDAGHETPGRTGPPAEGVLTQVCIECGKEYNFDEGDPPAGLTCEKCGNTVFRSFFTPLNDEVADDFRDSTERDLAPNDDPGDVTRGDIVDLNNL